MTVSSDDYASFLRMGTIYYDHANTGLPLWSEAYNTYLDLVIYDLCGVTINPKRLRQHVSVPPEHRVLSPEC